MSTLQDLRYKLQKRINRLRTVGQDGLGNELIRFFEFFDSNTRLRSCAAELRAKYPHVDEELDASRQRDQQIEGTTEGENAAIGLAVLRKSAVPYNGSMLFTQYIQYTGSIAEMLERFRDAYIEPFYEYIDEHIEDRNVVLAELIRFKHLAEWFRRNSLWQRWKSDSRSGERSLAFAVYEFLYEQGIDFHVEPASASGAADMIAAQNSANPLVADIKIFDPDSGRGASYIRRGIMQVHRYLNDYTQPIGYLIVFKGTEKQLDINASMSPGDEVPYFAVGEKTVFLIQVDIFPHELPASKRAIPERETISESEILSELESNQSKPAP
jgi:hypothetical protein